MFDSIKTSSSEYCDALTASRQLTDFREICPIPPELTTFMAQFWPMAMEYHSPLNSVFAAQLSDVTLMQRRETWLLRDGRIPLSNFFSRHVRPPSPDVRIYVEKSLARYVPRAWRPRTGTYRLVPLETNTQADRLMLCGLVTSTSHTTEQLVELLKTLKERRARWRTALAFVPARPTAWDRRNSHAFQYFSVLHSHFKNLRALEWSEIQFMTDCLGYELVELSNKAFVADCYMSHMILARGGYIHAPEITEEERLMPLSVYHGFAVQDQFPEGLEDLSASRSKGLGGWASFGV